MDVSIIMINYNTLDLTRNALNGIFAYTEGIRYEIILIDNASPDGSGEILQSEFSGRIIYIQAGKNLGTSKSFNLGLKSAVGKYVLWLNTDILIRDNFIGMLFQFMERNLDCGICGGNLLDALGRPAHSFERKPITVKSIKRQKSIFFWTMRKLFRKILNYDFNYTKKPLQVGLIVGADMMVRKNILDEIGGFDENIFMYCEESEFAYRMQKLTKYKVMSVPDAQMVHLEGASFGMEHRISEARERAVLSGYLVYFRKHFGDNAVKNYLNVLARFYRKMLFICKIPFLKNKREEYEKQKKILKEFMEQSYENL